MYNKIQTSDKRCMSSKGLRVLIKKRFSPETNAKKDFFLKKDNTNNKITIKHTYVHVVVKSLVSSTRSIFIVQKTRNMS